MTIERSEHISRPRPGAGVCFGSLRSKWHSDLAPAFHVKSAMSLAVLRSRALAGLAAPEVTVEVHLAAGLPSFALVGLPDTEVKEARDRVRAAIQNCSFEFPQRLNPIWATNS